LSLIKEEVVGFLRKVPPFQFLDEKELDGLTASITVEYYPKGTRILTQDGSPSHYLNVIKKGGVKVYHTSEEDEEIGIDYRGEGDSFGFLSLIGEGTHEHSRYRRYYLLPGRPGCGVEAPRNKPVLQRVLP
jgi:CBS domain-containing protein